MAKRPRSHASSKALSDTGLRFRLLVDSVIDYAIFMLDTEGRVVTWNPGAERIKGYRAQEIRGRHYSCFYPEEALRAGTPAHLLQVAAAEGRCEDEGWRLRKDGSRFWANVVITGTRRRRPPARIFQGDPRSDRAETSAGGARREDPRP